MEAKSQPNIFIAGDNIIDHHIYIQEKKNSEYPTLLKKSQTGGAFLIYDLICKAKGNIGMFSDNEVFFCHKESFRKIKEKEEDINFETGLLWNPFPLTNEKKNPNFKKKHWRIANKLGYGHTYDKNSRVKDFIFDLAIEPKEGDILVIDDGGLKFREDSKAHEKLLCDKWKYIILKTSGPVGEGLLFEKLINDYAHKLIVITTANELRESNIKISRGVSWEQSVTDLVIGLEQNDNLKPLTQCKTLIVTFSTEGAFYIQNDWIDKEQISKYRLLFDQKYLEREFIEEKIKGQVFGYQSTFTTAILLGLLKFDEKEKENKDALEVMINNGLSANRELAIQGHGNIKNTTPEYPYETVYKNFIDPENIYGFAFVPNPGIWGTKKFENWSILKGNYALEDNKNPLIDEAVRIVINPDKGLSNFPQYSVGYFFTVDRREIEGLRNIKQSILEYNSNKKETKPLSIAVFGSPGSGKSFIVKQLEKGIVIDNTTFLEFNLSQFSDPADIIGALHQVRDQVLDGKLPFVFWDEFDSKEYMWLQYLLAPMQDGKFQEGQITHNIGRCVFIFAGGTSYDFENFGPANPTKPIYNSTKNIELYKIELEDYKEKLKKYENFKLKKGPDFKSRLNGYLNVMGPNEEFSYNKETEKWDLEDKKDVFYPIRRAILFNALSGFDYENNDIDRNLLYAILKVPKYNHGARSFEKIIKSIFQNSNGKMLKSNLPPDSLLSSHVDKNEFLSLLSVDKDFDMDANTMAETVHNFWKSKGDKEGWKLEYHREFDNLPSHIKKENVAAVLRIPDILKAAGFSITEKESENCTKEFKTYISDSKKLNDLAILEHKGWREFRKLNKWKYNRNRNDDKKHHNCIRDFKYFSKKDKDKDRDAIKNIPLVLEGAGWYVRKG